MNDQHRMSPIKDSYAENTDVVHAIAISIVMLFSTALAYLVAIPFRCGYGRHFLFLIFVAPLLLIFGWAAMELVLKIHAEPQVFLAHWQAHVIRHPAAVHWTWLVQDLTQWIHDC